MRPMIFSNLAPDESFAQSKMLYAWPVINPCSALAKEQPVWNDSVAKPPRLSHATRRRSDDHDDGVAATWHRTDAIDANLKFRKPQKQTLSQRHGLFELGIGQKKLLLEFLEFHLEHVALLFGGVSI